MYKLNRIFSNEEGSGLVLALMVLLVLSVLGSALGMVTINSHRLADHTQDTNSAYYIAEAGANMAYEEFKAGVLSAYETSSTESDFFTSDDGVKKAQVAINTSDDYGVNIFQKIRDIQPTANVLIEGPFGTGSERTYTIKSTGAIAGKTRTVDKPINLKWINKSNGGLQIPLPAGDAAITLNGSLKSNVMPTINGVIYKTSNGQFAIDNKEHDKQFHGTNTIANISNSKWDVLSNINVNIPKKPEVSSNKKINNIEVSGGERTVQLSGDSHVQKLKMNNSGTLIIDTMGKELVLIIDELSLDNATINVVSGGKLSIYYTGTKLLTTNNTFTFNGSLIAVKSGITNGAQFNVTGDVIAGGNIDLNNNPVITGNVIADGHIKMMGATVSGDVIAGGYIELINNPSITGKVLADGTIKMQGAKVNGIILSTKDITFENTSVLNALVMAPNGKVTLKDNSILRGSLVAKEIQFNNNVTVTHSNEYLKYLQGGSGNGNSSETNIDDLLTTKPAIEQ